MRLFGNAKDREIRELKKQLSEARQNLTSARKHADNIRDDRDLWQRRAIENADRLTDTAIELRTAQRDLAARDKRIRELEQQVDHWVGPGSDRAIVPCGPVAPDTVKDRQIRELQDQLHDLQQRLTERQNATEASDWQPATAVAA